MNSLRRSIPILAFGFVTLLVVGCTALSLGVGGPEREAEDPGAEADGPGATPATDLASPAPLPTLDAKTLAQQLQGGEGADRLAAAWQLPERDDMPVEARAELLVEGLEGELAVPSQKAPLKDSYLPPSGMVKLHLTRALSELGPEGVPALRQLAGDASDGAREHLLVARVYAGDREAVPQVRDLVTEAADPVVRMDAARALGQAGDEEAVPQLEQALADPYVVTAEDDLGAYTLYPVREQAAGALRALGLDVERGADGEFRVGE